MFYYGKCVVCMLFLLLVCCLLLGCFLFGLIFVIDKDGNCYQFIWKLDIVIVFFLGKDSNGKMGWVFVGEYFDYLLIQGGDNVVVLLKDVIICWDKM